MFSAPSTLGGLGRCQEVQLNIRRMRCDFLRGMLFDRYRGNRAFIDSQDHDSDVSLPGVTETSLVSGLFDPYMLP